MKFSGVSGSTATLSRFQIASALAFETCWATMMEARLSKPGSERRSGTTPAVSRTGTRRSSARTSASSPASMSSGVSMRRILP